MSWSSIMNIAVSMNTKSVESTDESKQNTTTDSVELDTYTVKSTNTKHDTKYDTNSRGFFGRLLKR